MRPPEADLTGLWMVPYADLMSTLVILFLALFAYAYANKAPEYDAALARMQEDVSSASQVQRAQERRRETDLAVALKREMDRLALKDFGINVTTRYVHIVLPSPVLFLEDSATLNPEAGSVLGSLADVFAGVANPILVEGHTDNVPIASGPYRSNWELSAARAFSVIDFFIQRGLAPARFQARGYSEYRPVAANATPEGRGRNRRIEIRLTRNLHEEVPVP